MILLLICCTSSFVAGVFLTMKIYRGRIGSYKWKLNRALEYCDQYREVGEQMMREERVPVAVANTMHNDMMAGFEQAVANKRREW